MKRHGLQTDARTGPERGKISDKVLSEAEAHGAGLMVMGVVELSKRAHDAFGGITTDLIADAAFPCVYGV